MTKFTLKNKQYSKQKGFTLVETMIAVFVLTVSLTAFFSVIANSLFSARYANNEITANYLIQEAADYIRNDRDTIAFQQNDQVSNSGWANFQSKYSARSCFSVDGCEMEPATDNIQPCITPVGTNGNNFGTLKCDRFTYYPDNSRKDFYSYQTYVPPVGLPTDPQQCKNGGFSSFTDPSTNQPFKNQGACVSYVQNRPGPINVKRRVKMYVNPTNADEIDVTITVEWLNGNLTRTQSLNMSLLKWRNS